MTDIPDPHGALVDEIERLTGSRTLYENDIDKVFDAAINLLRQSNYDRRKYDGPGWIDFESPGTRPSAKNSTVSVILRDGTKLSGFADTFEWGLTKCAVDILSYRVEPNDFLSA